MKLQPASALSLQDVQWMHAFVRERPLLRLYLDAALDDLGLGSQEMQKIG